MYITAELKEFKYETSYTLSFDKLNQSYVFWWPGSYLWTQHYWIFFRWLPSEAKMFKIKISGINVILTKMNVKDPLSRHLQFVGLHTGSIQIQPHPSFPSAKVGAG